MKSKIIVSMGFIAVLLGCNERSLANSEGERIYKPIAPYSNTLEIDHKLQRVDFSNEEAYSSDVMRAQQDGALGAITLKVVDQDGHPVSNATVRGGFYNHGKNGYGFNKSVDANGLVELKNLCVEDLNFSIDKDGYYRTSLSYRFFKAGYDCAKDGRWIPWNPTIEVVLKRKINPVAMAVHSGINTLALPRLDEWTGFDLECADWAEPHGKGKHQDFQMLLQIGATNQLGVFNSFALTLRFTKPFDGVCLMKKESGGSAFQTLYEADTNRTYDSSITFTYERATDVSNKRVVVKDHVLGKDEYLVLRVRSEADQDGRLVKANYAKLCAPLFAANYGFLITSYFNPEINNPSIEADTTKNLRNPRELGFPP